jgi:hypothetical protein
MPMSSPAWKACKFPSIKERKKTSPPEDLGRRPNESLWPAASPSYYLLLRSPSFPGVFYLLPSGN